MSRISSLLGLRSRSRSIHFPDSFANTAKLPGCVNTSVSKRPIWLVEAAVLSNVTGYTDSGLLAGTTYAYRVRAYNRADNSAFTPEAAGTTAHNRDSWLAANFTPTQLADPNVSGQTADPDHDGLVNLLEYAFGGRPLVADVGLSPTVAAVNDHLTLTYLRRKLATDIFFYPEATSDIGTNWSTTGVTEELLAETSTNQTIRAADTLFTITGSVKRFLRLRVTRP